jgi:putative ABC transport system permease protein
MYEIVGVVKDTKYLDLREDLSPIAYVALAQDDDPDADVAITIRSTMDMGELIPTVDRTLTQIHPLISTMFYEMKTQVRDTLVRERLMATLSGFFGLLAGVLATIGLYGVISYMVVRRKNEIGIRMALGANRLRVLTLVLREATVLLCIGLGIGLVLSVITARAAGSLLFGLKPSDPLTLVMAAASLALVAVTASLLPAQRAARLDPLEALREE